MHRFVYHITTAKGANHVLYSEPQDVLTDISEREVVEAVTKSLSQKSFTILDWGLGNDRCRLYSFNQYNLDSIEVTLEEW